MQLDILICITLLLGISYTFRVSYRSKKQLKFPPLRGILQTKRKEKRLSSKIVPFYFTLLSYFLKLLKGTKKSE